jgi:hypothetical protein
LWKEAITVSKLKAALEAAAATKKGPQCSIAALLGKVDQDERKALVAALADPTRNRRILSEAIRAAYKVEIAQETLSRHMRHHCKCPR